MLEIYENKNGTYDLIDNETNLLITRNEFHELWDTDDFFILEKDKRKVIMTKLGSIIIDDDLESVFLFSDTKLKCLGYTKSDSYGIISPDKKVLKPIFDSITPIIWKLNNGSESFIVKLPDGRFTIWNSNKGLFTSSFRRITNLKNGFLLVLENRLMGLLHLEYNLELPLENLSIDYIGDCNRFIIKNEIGYRLLDEQLRCIIPEQNKLVFIGKEYFLKQNQLNCSIVDINGAILTDINLLDNDDWVDSFGFVYPNLPYFKKDGLFGFINLNTMVSKFGISKNEIRFFSGFAVVCNVENLYGLIDNKGNHLIKYELKNLTYSLDFFNYDYSTLNNIGFPYIAQNITSEKYCLISFKGDYLTDFIYDYISENENYSMSTNMYFFLKFKTGDKMGIMDIFGNEYFSDYFEYIDNEIYEQEEDILLLNPDDLEINLQNYPFYILKENHIHTIDDLPKNNVVFYAKKGVREGFINLNGEFIN